MRSCLYFDTKVTPVGVATPRLLMPKFSQKVFFMLQATKKFLNFTVYSLGLTCFLGTGLVSCSQFSFDNVKALGANVTSVRELQLQKNFNATVYIQGKVERKVPLLKRQAYLVNDSTGQIWVITAQTHVQKGEQVVIKGKVRYQPIPITANKDSGEIYLEEE